MRSGPTSALAHMFGRVLNSAIENPNVPITPEALVSLLGGGPTYAGPYVNERSAMRSSAVFACVALNSGLVAGLPLLPYGDAMGDRKLATDDPLYSVLTCVAHPDLALPAYNWKELTAVHQMLWGNHYSLIDRTNGGDVIGLIPLAPDRTQPVIRKVGLGFARDYQTTLLDGSVYRLPGQDVLHICGLGFDGLKGISVIQHMARQRIGASLAMEESQARILGTGARISGIVTQPAGKELSIPARDVMKEEFRQLYQGSFNAGEVMFLDNGMTFTANQMTLKDAELLEAMKFSVVDIARGFLTPPFFIGEMADMTAWGSGLEWIMRVFLMTGLDRWLKRDEAEINLKFFPKGDHVVEFDRDQLDAMNVTARLDAVTKALAAGGTANEARRARRLPGVEGGDVPMMSNNVRPMSEITTAAPPTKGTEP